MSYEVISGLSEYELSGFSRHNFRRMTGIRGLGDIPSSVITTGSLCGGAKNVQTALNDLGYGPLTVDGQLGSKSVAAIKKFSIDHSLGSKVWPDPTFCGALKAAIADKEAAAAAVAAQAASQTASTQQIPVNTFGPADQPTPVIAPAPAETPGMFDDPRVKYAAIGLGALLVLGVVAFAVSAGGGHEESKAELKKNCGCDEWDCTDCYPK